MARLVDHPLADPLLDGRRLTCRPESPSHQATTHWLLSTRHLGPEQVQQTEQPSILTQQEPLQDELQTLAKHLHFMPPHQNLSFLH